MEPAISLPRLAQKLNLPLRWLKEQALSGKIPCLKVGRKFLFSLTAVQNALANQAATSILTGNEVANEA